MTQPKGTLVERLEADPEHRVDMAAASAAVDTVALLNRAVRRAGLKNNVLARILGVSEGRVSQVLNGDGNLRVSTLARFLRASGYRLTIGASPLDESAPSLEVPRRRPVNPRHSAPRYLAVIERTVLSDDGVGPEFVVQLSKSHPVRLGEHYEAVIDLADGSVEGSWKVLHDKSPGRVDAKADDKVEVRSRG